MSVPDDRRLSAPMGRTQVRRQLRSGYRRSMRLVVLGTTVPGAGLLRTSARRAGSVLLIAFLLGLAAIAYLVVDWGPKGLGLYVLSYPGLLQALVVLLAIGGLVWCASIVATAVAGRPQGLDLSRTRVLAMVTTLMVALVATGTYKGAEFLLITQDTLGQVFSSNHLKPGDGAKVLDEPNVDPWRDTPRVNILLMGSDAGTGRVGTRPDSMIVASMDTRTGNTVLISVPRNFEWPPLPADSPLRQLWPEGSYGGTHDLPNCPRKAKDSADPCAINAIWTEVDEFRETHPEAFPGDDVPGRTQTRDVVGEVLGLKIDHMVVIDLKGFKELVNAMGGVEVNVQLSGYGGKLPIGGKIVNGQLVGVVDWFEPGRRRLSGYHALWYARTRAADTDEHRQMRQRCLIQAVVDQIDPAFMLTKYASIAKILQQNVYTDIPGQHLPAFVKLVERVQKGKITSLGFSAKNGFPYSSNPDYERVRTLVQKAINPPKPTSKPTTSTKTAKPTPTPTTKATPTEQPDVDECA
ncbi:LCP family protein [Intrasporangium sp.]|uniref:LCP family protein n=1 Tax=Intrasporangium sp. TaxID=1925024 RepID=UPI0033659A59